MKGHLRNYLLPFICFMLTIYATFHLIQGERGLLRLLEVNRKIKLNEQTFAESSIVKQQLKDKIKAFSIDSIDADTLDEMARVEYSSLLENEYVIFQ